MHCGHCRQQNPPGAKFCLECGQRLGAACAACASPLPDAARFCVACGAPVGGPTPAAPTPESYTPRHLAERILASRAAVEGERKPVTVLFCDLVGSTALAEQLGPEGMHALLNQFFDRALAEVHRYEGTINQFLGDGFMALFGAPLAHEDHGRRAVLAALGIQRTLEERPLHVEPGRSVPVRLRMGVHTGFVVVGAIGDNLRMDYTAVGDTTHLAARLQQLAEPGAIVVSDATAALVRGYVRLEPRGTVEVRGRSTPVSISLVTGPGDRRSPLEGLDARALSRFVGRDRELDILRGLVGEVEAGRGQVVGIVGEPGVGKSRLLLEFRRLLADRRLTYLEGRCLSFGGAIPYLPIIDIVRSNCEVVDSDAADTVLGKLEAALREVGMDVEGAPFLLHLLGFKDPADRLAGLSPESVRARTVETLRLLSVRGSHRQPLVLAVEDLHWIDRSSEEYLAELVESLAGVPLMLLATYRPGYRPPWLEKSYATQLPLGRLTATDSLSVVRSVLPEAGLADPLAKLILDRGEGNPFFLEELARAMGGQGSAGPALTVPETVHGVLTARIDRLAELPKRLLQTASVLGREFPRALLEAIWDGGSIEPHLRELTHHEFLYECSGLEEPTYAFKHALTQEVAEATLLAGRRRELHRRAADALAALHHDRLAELAPRLAHHYLRAEAWALACEHATRAAEAASTVYANREALERYDQALTAAERAGSAASTRRRLHAARGHVHNLLGAFEPARADLETALALARREGDAAACAELLGVLGEVWGGHKNYARGLELTLEAVQAAEAAGDSRVLAESLVRTGLMQLNVARIGESERQLERALAIFRALGDERGCARTLDVLAMAVGIGGRLGRCLEHGREARQRYQALGDRMAEPSIVTNIGFWLAFAGHRAEASAQIQQGLAAAIAVGGRSDEAYAHMGMGELLELYGEYGGSLRESIVALDIAREIGHLEWTAAALSAMGRLVRTCGAPERARRLHEEMLTIARELGAVTWTADALGELGQDALAMEDRDEAAALLAESVMTAGEAVKFAARPLLAQADLMLRQGRPDAARATALQVRDAISECPVWTLEARRLEGEALVALGHRAEGRDALGTVRAEASALHLRPILWRACLGLADLLEGDGRRDAATAARADALTALRHAASDLPDDLQRSFFATSAMRRAEARRARP